ALYAAMRKIDANHLKAAASLGARPAAAVREGFLPLSLPGVVNGSLLVFVTCLGFFVTPILLGTPRDMMISQLINQQIEELLAWGVASAVAVLLLGGTGGAAGSVPPGRAGRDPRRLQPVRRAGSAMGVLLALLVAMFLLLPILIV